MSTNHDRLCPSRYWPRHALQDDRFTEYGPSQNIPDRPVWTLPHALQFEFLDTSLIRCNSSTLDANRVLEDSLCRLDGNFIIRCIAMFQAKIIIFDIEIEIREDELEKQTSVMVYN
jgi:hypothetical protein